MLTGKYRRTEAPPVGTRLANAGAIAARALNDRNFDRVEALDAYARGQGHSLLTLAFCWLLARPSVCSVIAGATSPQQVRGNAASAGWSMSTAELEAIDAIAPLRAG